MFEKFLGALSIGAGENKANPENLEQSDGIVSAVSPILNVDTKDEELIQQKKKWLQSFDQYSSSLRKRQDDSENYWLGKQKEDFISNVSANHPLNDNIIFESLETFLPQATKKNPEPIVSAHGDAQELADNVRKMLIYLSDTLNLKLKIKSVVRNWALYFFGVIKIGWDVNEDDMTLSVVRPHKLILDPDATIDEKGRYFGKYIGEYKKDTAEDLIEKFPDKKDFITDFVKGKMGTQVQYIEWWASYGRIVFWTLREEVLQKALNPHFNYEETKVEIVVDEYGNEEEREESFTRANHFKQPQIPYVFLSVFNLGIHPWDDTSLIEQNLGNQDLITKRYRQIDDNVDGMNGGWVFSGDSGISKDQSSDVIRAFRQGRGVWLPTGNVDSVVKTVKQSSLPADVFTNLQDARNELRGIFGIAGSTPHGTEQEKTVRGKIMRAGQDQSRIGGGITEYIEQFADTVFNYMVQMMYVYYDADHIASIIGSENTFETITIRNEDLTTKLLVSVKEGSLIPKDPLTQANQAIDLWNAGAIDPITLHERLDDPNPRETVKKLIEFKTNPQTLLGDAMANTLPAQQGTGGGIPEPTQDVSNALLNSMPVE